MIWYWPTAAEIHEMHFAIVTADPHDRKYPGVLVPGMVENLVAEHSPRIIAGEVTLALHVARLLRGLVVGHPYGQANKRTAFMTAVVTFRENRVRLEAVQSEASEFMRWVAKSRPPAEAIAVWLANHSAPL